MTEVASTASGLLTIRSLRQNPSLAPQGEHHWVFIRRFLPMVHGMAAALIPENPAAAEEVSVAVFEAFAAKWRKLPQKTFVAAWLVHSTVFAVARERYRIGLPARSAIPAALRAQFLFKRLVGFKPHLANPLILRFLQDEQLDRVATAMGKKLSRVSKWLNSGLDKLTKPTISISKKLGLPQTTPSELLRLTPALLIEERFVVMATRMIEAAAAPKRSPLATAMLKDWAWRNFFETLCQVGMAAGTAVLVFATILGTFIALVASGKLNLNQFFLRNNQKEIVKRFPGIDQPARPWTPPALAFPQTSADLYKTTNIWPATIRFTSAQWKAVQPQSIQPERMNQNGKFTLRNPKATRSGLAGVVGIDFPYSEGSFEFAGQTFDKVGVRYRGNGTYLNSLWGNKQSFKVDLNRIVKKQDIAKINTLNFVNSVPDFSYLKDALAQKLFRELGAAAPRTAYAYLTMHAPGKLDNQPLGLYLLIENIDADFAKDRFGSKDVPIFKPVTYELFHDWGDIWDDYAAIFDLKTKATLEQKARVVELAKLVSHASDEEFAQKIADYLDFEEYAAFVAGHVLTSSYDGYLNNGQNFYVYLDPRSNKFGFIPWDQDHGWGEFGYVSTADKRENASIWRPATYDNKFLNRVLKVEAFKEIYRRKLEQGLAGPFTVERLYREIDALAAVIRPAVAAESDFRLARFETAISTNWVSGPRDGHGMSGAEGPAAPPHQLKRFIHARVKSVREQLDGKHEGDRLGGMY